MEKIFEYGKAICYSGYRRGQSPKTEMPTRAQIEEDLRILAADGYKYIRMYDPNLHARMVLETIRNTGLDIKCLIGIDSDNEINNKDCPWDPQDYSDDELRAHKERNDRECEKLIELVKEFDNEVIAVSVGNENTPGWGAHMVSEERLIEHADRLKRELSKPVTFCEGVFEWPHLLKLKDHLDFISVHSYPLHYGKTIEEAVPMNMAHYKEMQELFPDKQVIFTEMGWTDSPNEQMAKGQANVKNEERYIKELTAWLEKDQVVAFIFEAFDEPWKGSRPESSECHWGLYTVDRVKKW